MELVIPTTMNLDDFMVGLIRRNPHEAEFHQAVREVAEKVIPFVNQNLIQGTPP